MGQAQAPVRISSVSSRAPLSETMIVRWRCHSCGALHLDRSPRLHDVRSVKPWRKGRPFVEVWTTECCGDQWFFVVTPLERDLVAGERVA